MNVETIGIIGTLLVLVSFLSNNLKTIRIINLIGSIIFIIYGILINAFSVWFLNGMLLIIHIVKLLKER